jgi:hypothetical protein
MEQELFEKTKAACDSFSQSVKGLEDEACVVGKAIADLDECYLGPIRKQYPYYSKWIDSALSDTINGRPLSPPVSNEVAFIRIDDKATHDQMLKVMLLTGSREQMFAAAKEIGLCYMDLPETDENYEQLKKVVQNLNAIFG